MNFKKNVLTIFCSTICFMLLAQTTPISKVSVKWDEIDDEKVLPMDNSFELGDGNP